VRFAHFVLREQHLARRFAEKVRYRLSRESGTVTKPHGGRVKFALAFPSTYYVGMSNLGLQIVYRLLNNMEDAVCERVFLPDPPDLLELETARTPLFTLESQTPVQNFDVLAFSLSYEMDYPNVLKILSLSGVGLTSAERDDAQGFAPIVIAGGPAATFNPEPLANFIDVFVIGEAEPVLPEIVSVLSCSRGELRPEVLKRLAAIEGVYVPSFYTPHYKPDGTLLCTKNAPGMPKKVKRRFEPDLKNYPSVSAIVTPETEFADMILAEVARGCGRHCRFCVAGHAYLPPRARAEADVIKDIADMRKLVEEHTGKAPRVGLLSASVFDHPSSLLICRSLIEDELHFSISSTRADTLNEDIVAALRSGGHQVITIAPESGTDRLRRIINKQITGREVRQAARIAFEGGFRRVKLYFMLGLPTEGPEDVDAIRTLVEEIAVLHPWEKVIVSVSCFVPKPWTPFEWCGMKEERDLSKDMERLRSAFSRIKRVELLRESPREALVQGVLARGDRRLAGVIEAVSKGMNWRQAWREGGIDPGFYATRERPEDEVFPWDHIDLGISKKHLWHEYELGLAEASSAACMVGPCRRCGVCR
jgi:radical SAM family uncharacterized protein